MIAHVSESVLELVEGNIVAQRVDAIVNAANSELCGGGGVDDAIHRAGGPEIMEETRRRYPDGCTPGDAVASGAGELPARYVIHAVGPVYRGGSAGEPELLASAYARSLALAAELECESVALPSLSTGAYGYPMADAARIALRTAISRLEMNRLPQRVRFVLFGRDAYRAFEMALAELLPATAFDRGNEGG